MADSLYDTDILAWSESQADLLRRVANGHRVNEVDWEHVVEEIADVGISQLSAVHSLLTQAVIHLLKIHLWPEDTARIHWRLELDAFQDSAIQRFAPSMRQRLDVGAIWQKARSRLERDMPNNLLLRALPSQCPLTLDQLLNDDQDRLLTVLLPPAQS